jgi:ankyrin repeat protein
LDLVDDRGRSALMIAASLGHTEIVTALIAAGADRTLKDKTGKTARDLAGNPQIEAILATP